jgi:hypothetical protein
VTGILESARQADRQVAEAEEIVVKHGRGEFLEPQRIKLLKTEGLEVESGHVAASAGLHVVLGRNHAGKTRLLRAVAAGQCSLTIPFTQLPSEFHKYEGVRDLAFDLIWSRSRQSKRPDLLVTTVAAELEPQSALVLQARRQDLNHTLLSALSRFAEQRVRLRPAIVVPTERYLQPEASLTSMPSSLDNLADFPAILENLQRDLSTRPLFEKIHEAFRDVTEGLSLDFLGTGGVSHLHIIEQDGTLVPIEHCGDGLRDLLVILSYLHVYERCDLMLDEPGLRLHPHAQRRLLRYLEGASRQRAIWIASHDGVFVGAPSVRSRHLVTRDPALRVSKVTALPDETQVRRAVAHLGWVPRDALLAERVLLCEGEADEVVFRAVLDRLAAEEPEMGGTLVAELGGDGRVWSRNREALELIDLLRQLSPHARHVLLVDPGDPSKRARAEEHVRFYREKGVRLYLLARNELENYFLTPRLVRELLVRTIHFGRWPEGTPLPAEPGEADVSQELGDVDPIHAKGSEILDGLFQRRLNRGYRKTEGARWAAELLPTHAPELERMLRQELRAALAATEPSTPGSSN